MAQPKPTPLLPSPSPSPKKNPPLPRISAEILPKNRTLMHVIPTRKSTGFFYRNPEFDARPEGQMIKSSISRLEPVLQVGVKTCPTPPYNRVLSRARHFPLLLTFFLIRFFGFVLCFRSFPTGACLPPHALLSSLSPPAQVG